MLTFIFGITAIVCAVGWFCYWLSTAMLIMYMLAKGYTLPTEEESKACMIAILRKLFKPKR